VSSIKGNRPRYYRCVDCGGWHRRQRDGSVPPCSVATKQRAVDQIERLLAQAFGHGAQNAILKRAAERINTWAEYASWGSALRETYSGDDHILSRYIRADAEELRLLRAEGLRLRRNVESPGIGGHNWQLTDDEAALVVAHWPLVESEAQKIARKDTELHDRLTAIGRAELEKAVRRWDITREITFGAFVRKRIHGCMVNYLDRVWNRDAEPQGFADANGKRWFKGLTPVPRLAARLDAMLRPAAPPESRLIPGKQSQGKIEAALAKLNPRQRAVYRGRVLTKPPVSRATLARQLDIADVTQISRIEKQARRKMRGRDRP